jgi:hypothetical protein
MPRSSGHSDGVFGSDALESLTRDADLEWYRFFRGLGVALTIEAGVGAFIWLAICVT